MQGILNSKNLNWLDGITRFWTSLYLNALNFASFDVTWLNFDWRIFERPNSTRDLTDVTERNWA